MWGLRHHQIQLTFSVTELRTYEAGARSAGTRPPLSARTPSEWSATGAAEREPCSSARAIRIHRPSAIHSRTARGSAFIANASGPKTRSSGAQWMKRPSGGQSASTAEHRRRSLLSAAGSRRRRALAHLFRPPCHALAALSGGPARHASRPSLRCHQTALRPGRSHRRCAPLAVPAASAASAT